MDMNTVFDLEIRKHCPNACAVYDLFHVVVKYGSEVIGRLRLGADSASYWRGIVSWAQWPIHAGQMEGINDKIKGIRCTAYGYHDSDFFFLKIKAAFSGNP